MKPKITILVRQDDIPIRGNVLVSGDDEIDRLAEDDVVRQLSEGNVWAWCCITVRATWGPLVGEDHLGACSYANLEDFQHGGYYEDMVMEAIFNLRRAFSEVLSAGEIPDVDPLEAPATVVYE